MTDSSTTPTGKIHLPVTFGTRDNYHTELIDFNMAYIGLPYNAILGYLALAKFMVEIHDGYNILMVLGSSGVITITCDEKDVVSSLKRSY